MSQCITALVWLLVGVQCHPFAGTTATSSLGSIQGENATPRPWLWIGSLSTSTADIGPLPPTPAPAKENGLLEHYMGFFQKRANTDIISSYISETSSLSLPTSCIPSSLLDSCPASCSSNADIAKCTDFTAPYCSSSPYTSSSGTTITVITGWGCAPTPFTETTASSSQSSTLIPINSTTAISSSLANGIPTTTQSSPPPTTTATAGKSFPTGKHPSLSIQQRTGNQKLTKPDFSLGGKIGCAIGASIVVALFLWW